MKTSSILCGAVGVCLFTSTALAGNVADSSIVTFTASSTAKAAEVNQNFTKLKEANNDNDARITTNTTNITANTTAITAKQNRVTGTCSAGSAVNAISADGSVTCGTAATRAICIWGTLGNSRRCLWTTISGCRAWRA